MSTRVVHMDQKIVWVDGKPVAKYTKIINKDAVSDLPLAVMGMRYERDPLEIELGVDEDLEGMTYAEVMMIRMVRQAASTQSGSAKARGDLLDRVLGKPKTSAEVKSVKFDYKDYLEEMAKTIDAEEVEYTENSL